jgi:putative endonuclease
LFCTYVLYSSEFNRFYIGQCEDISARLIFHNKGNVRSTKPFLPWTLVGYIEKPNRSDAMILERKLKNLNSEDLKKFILKYFEKSF